jgi:hypothetical protein
VLKLIPERVSQTTPMIRRVNTKLDCQVARIGTPGWLVIFSISGSLPIKFANEAVEWELRIM